MEEYLDAVLEHINEAIGYINCTFLNDENEKFVAQSCLDGCAESLKGIQTIVKTLKDNV